MISNINTPGNASISLSIGDTNSAEPAGIRVKSGVGTYDKPFEFEVVHGLRSNDLVAPLSRATCS
jgi:hypothetical protein